MKQNEVKDIQELIDYLLRVRELELLTNEETCDLVNSFPDNYYDLEKENIETLERFDKRLVTLNNLLKKEQRNTDVLEIEREMIKMQAKKYITVKELAEIYNISKSSQQDYRGRMHDPLPFRQKVQGGKIEYVVKDVEAWLQNQHK